MPDPRSLARIVLAAAADSATEFDAAVFDRAVRNRGFRTTREFCLRAGLDETVISQYRNGKRRLTPAAAERLAKAFKRFSVRPLRPAKVDGEPLLVAPQASHPVDRSGVRWVPNGWGWIEVGGRRQEGGFTVRLVAGVE